MRLLTPSTSADRAERHNFTFDPSLTENIIFFSLALKAMSLEVRESSLKSGHGTNPLFAYRPMPVVLKKLTYGIEFGRGRHF